MTSRALPPNRRVRSGSTNPGTVVRAPSENIVVTDAPEGGKNRKRLSPNRPKLPPGPPRPSLWQRIKVHGAKLRTLGGLLLVAGASIGVAWGIRYHVLHSPRFSVRAVRVEGTSRRTPEQVVTAAGVRVGMNIFSLDLEAARQSLLQDPWIESAQIERKLPSSLTLRIDEREAAAAVAIGQDLYLCSPEGEPFKRLESGDPSKLLVVTGLSAEQVSNDRQGVIRKIHTALELGADYERNGPSKTYPAQEIHIAQDGTLQMTVGKSAVLIEFGKAPYRKKVLRAARVLAEVERRKAEPAIVFVDNEAHPERVVVRMR